MKDAADVTGASMSQAPSHSVWKTPRLCISKPAELILGPAEVTLLNLAGKKKKGTRFKLRLPQRQHLLER